MRDYFFAGVILLCIALLLTACGMQPEDATLEEAAADENTSASSTGIIEPEQLISIEEAGTLLGMPVKDGSKSEMTSVGQKTVLYDPVTEGAMRFLQISLTQQGSIPSGSTINHRHW